MGTQKIAELVSLFLTVPTVILAATVVFVWHKSAIRSLMHKPRTGTDWLIMGVAISFIGSLVDNLFWGIVWTAAFLESDKTIDLFNVGVFFNIFFRQLAGICAGFCHIKSATTSAPLSKLTRVISLVSIGNIFMGVLFTVCLLYIKYNGR